MPGSAGRWLVSNELPIYMVVLLFFMGQSLLIMTGLPYITYGVCRDMFPNATAYFCLNVNQHPDESTKIKELTSLYFMAEKMINTIPPLLLATFFGPWSDVHGRKIPLLLPFLGNLVSMIMFFLVHYLNQTPVISFVMAAFIFHSFLGGNILIHLISFSYMADVVRASCAYEEIGVMRIQRRKGRSSTASKRQESGSKRLIKRDLTLANVQYQSKYLSSMSRLQIMQSVGLVVGSCLSWTLQTVYGAPLAFGVAGCALILGIMVVLVWLKETRRSSLLQETNVRQNALSACMGKVRQCFSCETLGLDPVVMWGCLLIIFLMYACKEGRGSITLPFVQQPPLSWSAATFSAYIAAYSAFQSIFLFFFVPFLHDRTVVIISLVCTTAGGMWLAFSTDTWSMFLAGCFSQMVDCVFPALRAILCKHLRNNKVGRMLSRTAVAEALSSIFGPLGIVYLFNNTYDYHPGVAFVASSAIPAGILLVGAAAETFYHPKTQQPSKVPDTSDLGPRDASQRPDFTQSANVPSATVSGYGFMWCSTEW